MADKVIRYRGEFDASNILASLKNIRSEMQKNGADSALFGNVDKDIQKAESLMRDLQAQIKTGFRNQKDIDNFDKKFQTLNQTLSKVNVGLGDIAKPENFKIQSKELDNLNKQIQKNIQAQEELGKAAKEAVEGFSTKAMKKELNDAIDKGEKLEETLKKIGEQQFSSRQGTLSKRLSKFTPNEINGAMDAGKVGNNLNLSDKGLTKYQEALKAIAVQGQNVREVFEALKNNLDNSDKEILESSDFVKQYTGDIAALIEELRKVPNKELEAGNANKALREMTYGGAIDLNGEFQINKESVDSIVKLQEEYGKLAPLQEKLKQLEEELAAEREKNANIAVNGLTAAGNAQNRVAEETDKATQATREQMAAQEATNRTFDNIKNTITRLTSLTAIVSTVTREIKQTAHIIQDLDKAFGQIAMVTDYSIEDMWSKYQSYADLANKLGQSTLSVVQASGLYFQQGLEEAEALQLTESTMKLATLAGLDFQQATSLMTSAVRGFHMEMSEGEHVTDVYSELAAHAAASVEGIANAMSRTAAIASSAGMEFETTAAMLTTMIEATQESPETLGTAMKTVIARFTELKDNVSALDSEFDDLDYNKVDKALKSIGVSLKDTNGQFRDIDDVFLEVSERWDTLDRNTQRYIATTAAGSRQQSRFIALMENYDRTMELIGTAQDSAGRSSEQFAKYQDTLENKVNRLKNSWEQLRLQFLKSDFLKTAVGLLNNLVISMNKVDPKKLLGLGIIGIAIGKNIALNLVDNVSKGIKNQQEKLSTAWGKVFTKVYEEKTNIIVGKYTEKLNAAKTEQEKINKELEEQNSKLESQERYYNLTSIKVKESKNLVEEIKNKITQQNNEENEVTAELNRQLSLREQNLRTDEEKLVNERQELLIQQQKTEELKKQQNINNKKVTGLQGKINTVQGNLDENAKAASEMTSLVSSAVSSGIFVGITTFLASKDTKTSLLAAGGALVASLGPILLEKAVTAGLEKLAASAIITAAAPVITAAIPVLAGMAVVAAATAFVGYEIWYNSEEQKLKRKIKEDKEELERLSEQASNREDSAEKAEKEYEDLNSLYEKWKELNTIKIKSTKQQEEFNKLNDELAQDYPELVKNYNAETHELQLQTDLLEEQLKKLREKKLLTEQESIQTNARAAAQKAEWETDKKRKELRDKEEEIAQYDLIGGINSKTINNVSQVPGTHIPLDYINDPNYTITNYKKLLREKEKIDEEIVGSEEKKWKAILDTSEESLKKYYGDNESTNAAIDIARQKAENGAKDLVNLSIDDKNMAAQTYKNVSGYTTKDTFKTWFTDETTNVGGLTKKEIKKEGAYDFFKVLADYNNEKLDDFIDEINESEITWKELWDDYKEAIISGYMSAAPQQIFDELGKDGAAAYTDFVNSLTGMSKGELKDNKDEMLNKLQEKYGFSDDIIEELRKKIVNQINELSSKETDVSAIFGNLNFDDFSQEAYSALEEVQKDIVEITGDSDLAQEYLTNMGKLFSEKGLDASQINQILSSTDFTEIDPLNLDQFKEEQIEFFKSLGIEGAEEFYKEWAEIAQQSSLWNDTLDENEIESFTERATEQLEGISDLIPDVISWAEDSDIKGFKLVEKDDIDKVRELGEALGINVDSMYELDKETGKYKLNVKDLYDTAISKSSIYIDIIKRSIKDLEKQRDAAEEGSTEREGLQNRIDDLEQLQQTLEYTTDSIQSQTYNFKDYTSQVKNFNSGLNSLISTYENLSKEMSDNGHVSADSINSLKESLDGIDEIVQSLEGVNGFQKLEASAFFYKTGDSIEFTKDKLKDYINSMIAAMEVQINMGESCDILAYYQLVALRESFQETANAAQEYDYEKVQNAYEEWQEALEKVKEKEEAVAEAEEKVKEAEEELLETEEKLQEIYYGEANHKNKLDYLYNYTTELEQLEKKAKDAAEALDNLSPDDDVHQKVEDYKNALAEEIANYKAQNEVIKQYLANQKQMLDEGLSQRLEQLKAEGAVDTSTNVSDFYYERDGRWYVDYQKLNAAKLPDDVSDFIEEQVDNMNKYAKAYEDNLDKIEQARKEFEQRQKAARDKYIEVENKVVELLKKKDQEELDNLKNKYDGMKEADDEYTSALEESIKKQRDLRNQANQWDDLAEKEKKLSLQQRDTSGANAKEIQKTQDDITKTRESLLDNAVDNIVNNLKELYAEQEETRQAEIEYRQAILDNKNYIDEATAIINNWENAQDALDFFMEMDEQFNEASDATFSKLVDDVEGYYSDSVYYYEMAGQDFEDVINQANEEANSKIRDTSETLTSESERALDETMDKVHEAQEKGREDVEAAKKAVEDAKQAVVDATKAVAEALEEARKKQEEYNAAIAAQPVPEKVPPEVPPEVPEWSAKTHVDEYWDNISNTYNQTKGKEMLASYIMDRFNLDNTNQLLDVLRELGTRGYHSLYNSSKNMIVFGDIDPASNSNYRSGWTKYATGGLVDYTGPAWVDGTSSNPEAFLSADDTRRIDILTNILSSLPAFDLNSLSKLSTLSNTIGDATFNIDINVESISSDYDVDQMVERVHEDILSITNRPGTMVTLSR